MFSTGVSLQAKQKPDTFNTEVARGMCKQAGSSKNFKQQVKKPVFVEMRSIAPRCTYLGQPSQILPQIAAFKKQNALFEVALLNPAKVEGGIAISNTSSKLL
jgi:hypothetical protein